IQTTHRRPGRRRRRRGETRTLQTLRGGRGAQCNAAAPYHNREPPRTIAGRTPRAGSIKLELFHQSSKKSTSLSAPGDPALTSTQVMPRASMPRDPIRVLLDELKPLVDAVHAVDRETWIRGKKMLMHAGASEKAVKAFFASDVGLGFPPSYAEFLLAS